MRVPISEFKQQLLWEQIIVEWIKDKFITDASATQLLNCSTWDLAAKAKEAWYILKLSNLSSNDVKSVADHPEFNAFIAWSDQYQDLCQHHHYLHDVSTKFVEELPLIPDLTSIGIRLPIEGVYKVMAADLVTEFNYAAQWARIQLTPASSKIGIIVFDLAANYAQIDYIFSNYFTTAAYQIDLAVSIKDDPFIQIGLLILELTKHLLNNTDILYSEVSKLLTTKFIVGSDLELGSRSFLDYILRKTVDYKFNWQYIKDYLIKIVAKYHNECQVDLLINTLLNFEKVIQNWGLQAKHDCQGWIGLLAQVFEVFGWGKTHIDPQIQDLLAVWQEVLNDYLELADMLKAHEFNKCLEIINKLLDLHKFNRHSQLFAKEQHEIPKIIIMDFKQAIKCTQEFDAIWVCDVSEINLPKKLQFNPFLPVSMQKSFLLKNQVLNEQEIYYQYLQHLINHTKIQCIFSYPLYLNNILVAYSPLIEDFMTIDLATLIPTEGVITKANDIFAFEKYEDNMTTEYANYEFSGINGLKLQIACPFRANAKIRLRADPLVTPKPYLTKNLIAEILHQTLANFYSKYRSSTIAKQLTDMELYEELTIATTKHLKNLQKIKINTLNSAVLNLETDSIVQLCYSFITQYDFLRSSYEVVAVEKKITVKLKEFLIKIRVDRIDSLANGDLLVIDYKTGRILANYLNIADGLSDDPQMIIYSLIDNNIRGLILAYIKNEGIKLTGILKDTQILPELTTNKFKVLADWDKAFQAVLENLHKIAVNFKQGVALVQPKYGDITCKTCDLQGFCRINTM